MALTLDDLFASPDHYLHSFEGDAAVFMPMDREAYHRSIFLDTRISPKASLMMRLPVGALIGQVPAPRQTGWIFHVAHCGSTLLARAIDRTEGNLVLREPFALRQLGIAPDAQRLPLVAAMLSKRYRADLPTVIKANVPVNFLLDALAATQPEARAIFLHLGLRDYLLAILRNDKHREWMRRISGLFAARLGLEEGSGSEGMDDAERAAALWLGQMRAFASAIGRLPDARSLDAETFFADPGRLLPLAAAQLGVDMDVAEAAAIVSGPLFSTYSKNPELPFDNDARMARRRALEAALEPEIARAQAWVAAAGGAEAELGVIAGAALGA